MKERPILFSAAMVRAILEGRKVQTRRVVNPQPRWGNSVYRSDGDWMCALAGDVRRCPYGVPGDRLWVRETFALECDREYVHESNTAADWRDGRPFQTHRGGDGDYDPWHTIPRYRATEPDTLLMIDEDADSDDPEDMMKWTPSIHMPRWASRITLEITDVSVQRAEIDYTDERVRLGEWFWLITFRTGGVCDDSTLL